MALLTLKDLYCRDKRVLIREDLNVPMENGNISSDARIRAALPTLQYAISQGASVIVLSHLGRPKEGTLDDKLSLKPVANQLQFLLNHPVKFKQNWINGFNISPKEVVLCENVRFQKGEKKNDPMLAKKIAQLSDIFVMDAFATLHRREASTLGAAQFSSQACAGFLLASEIKALTKCLKNPARPLLAIVGGSKVSSKLHVLSNLLNQVDSLILGGGIANTFLVAQGYKLGKSLIEKDLVETAKNFIGLAHQKQVNIILPLDVIVAKEISAVAQPKIKNLAEIKEDEIVLDCGPKSIELYNHSVLSAATILWNGPLGVFEIPSFEAGTRALSLAIAKSKAFSIAGGGDTLAAIEKYNVRDRISYISTGGGAFLEFIEGKKFPILKILEKNTEKNKVNFKGSKHEKI